MPHRAAFVRFVHQWERVPFLLLYAWLLSHFAKGFVADPNLVDGLYVLDQTIVMLFLLFHRQPAQISERPIDCIVALLATLLPLLAVPHQAPPVLPEAVCVFLILLGTLFHLSAKLSLRRSFGILPADRGIKSGGAYHYVRHPMYLGYWIVQVALLLAGPSAWNAVLFATVWVLLIWRIHIEERLLRQNRDYEAFCARTPYRLIPYLY